MDVYVKSTPLAESDADALLVYAAEEADLSAGMRALDETLGGAIGELMEGGDFSGKAGQTAVIYPRGTVKARRVILVGLGKDLTLDKVRRAAAVGIKRARDLKSSRIASALPEGLAAADSARGVVEGALLGAYSYRGQKSTEDTQTRLESLDILSEDATASDGVKLGQAVAAGAITARDLVNLPPNICTPSYMAERAQAVADETGLYCEVLHKKQIEALRMGAFLAVTQGSETPPRFIILEHNRERAQELDTLVLVGKGVTFDTGGYSIKTGEGMIGMKADMSGAAAVIGAMQTIAMLDVPLHVVGLVPTAENMISGNSYRPQDVITASNGKTIEIISTDAEGRMLLADTLVYAKRYNPAAVVDIATLTGACVVALGSVAAGLFVTDDKLRQKLMAAADITQERLWELPLFPEYRRTIESDTADMKNAGGRTAGVAAAAVFLKEFVDYPAWAHIDMAGMMLDTPDTPYTPAKGGSGYGARLLVEFVRQWAE